MENRSSLDYRRTEKNPQSQGTILVKTWQEKVSPSQLSERWTGPYFVCPSNLKLLVKKGSSAWVHKFVNKTLWLTGGGDGTETQNQRTMIPVEPVKTSDSCSHNPSNLPQISKMHPMMFLPLLIMSPCTAVNLLPK